MKRIFLTSFKLCFGLLAAVIVMELSLHIIAATPLGKVFPLIEPQMGEPDTDTGFALGKNRTALWSRENRAFVSTNSNGLRDREYSKTKKDSSYRVALSGDSIVEALQVENKHVFDNIAEDKFKKDDQDVEILNFAQSGNGPLRQLTRLEKFAAPYSPDMIVMLISAGDFQTQELLNDSVNPAYAINENGAISRSYSYKNRFSQRYAQKPVGKAFSFLMYNSHLFRLLWNKKNEPARDILGLNAALPSLPDTAPDLCYTDQLQSLHDFWVTHKPDAQWQVTNHYFKEVSKFAKGLPVMIGLYIPIIEAVDCQHQQQIRQDIVQNIDQLLGKNSITFIDWNAEAKNKINARGKKTLRGFGLSYGSGHLNYDGHKVFADILHDVIKDKRK